MECIFRSSLMFSGDLVSTQEDETHGQYKYIEQKREVLEQDQSRMQIPILFWVPESNFREKSLYSNDFNDFLRQ